MDVLRSIIKDAVPPSPGIVLGNEALCAAAERGDFWSLRKYLLKGFPVNGKDNRGWRPLQLACMGGSHACVRQLLAMPDIEIKPQISINENLPLEILLNNPEQATPMLLASAKGHANCIRVLKEAGIQVSSLDALAACAGGHLQCLIEILPDLQDSLPEDALILAAQGGYSNCVRLILEETTTLTKDLISQALLIASEKGNYLCVKELLSYTLASPNAWFVAARGAHLDCLNVLLESDPFLLNVCDNFNKSALQYVIEKGNRECVAMLIGRGAVVTESKSILDKFKNDLNISKTTLDITWNQSKSIPEWDSIKQLIEIHKKRLILHPSIQNTVLSRWNNYCRPFCLGFTLLTLCCLFVGRPDLILFTSFICQYLHILPTFLAINFFGASFGSLLFSALFWYHHGYLDSFSFFPFIIYYLFSLFSIQFSYIILLFLPLLNVYRNFNKLSTTNILFQISTICLILNRIFLFRILLIPSFALALSILVLSFGSHRHFYFSKLDILLTMDLYISDWIHWCEMIKFIIKTFIYYKYNLILWYINK